MFDQFYGLKGRPFQLTPDPAFYFESLTHRKARSYLGYGMAQGEGFVVITGEVGAGKSTLVAHLMASIDPNRLTAAQIVTSKLDEDEIIHVVAQAFGLEIEGHDKATALGAIETFLHEEARAGRRCLLVVDESQNLSIEALEELRMLSNFQLGAHPLLQTLLLGQPEFRDLMQKHPSLEQLRQRVIAAHHLDAMEPNEVRPYIEHRLNHVGWAGRPTFSENIFPEIYKATAGVPRRVNQVMSRLLLMGAVEQRQALDHATLVRVLDELVADGTLNLASAAVKPVVAAPASYAEAQAEAADAAVAGLVAPLAAVEAPESPFTAPAIEVPNSSDPTVTLEATLASRDSQIAELQAAVLELSAVPQSAPGDQLAIEALQERLAALESRLIEQDRTIRHTLTMLIEWIEGDQSPKVAA